MKHKKGFYEKYIIYRQKQVDLIKVMYYNNVVEKSGELCLFYPTLCGNTPLIRSQIQKKEAAIMAFLGSSNYSLDAKNRVFIPAKYREELGSTFYVTRNLESCLTIYTEEEWNLFLQSLDRLPNTTGAVAKEYFMSAAQKCQPDGSGRILLDDTLRTHSQMNKNVVFVGAGRVINVWSEELWSKREATRDLESIRSILQQYEL